MSKENADYLMARAQAAGISEPEELANFMGQMQVESNGFKSMEEDLTYSGTRLLTVFRGRNGLKTLEEANEIAGGGPEVVANTIYGGEWGERRLGNKEPGDGWKYRGRGYIQLTGHDRYAEAGAALGLDLINKPELAADRENAANIANWYWKSQVVAKGDQKSTDDATYDINSAGAGLTERRAAAALWRDKLEHGYVSGSSEPNASHTLKQGMRGDDVRHLQEELHDLGYLQASPNGRFGPATKAATVQFQHDQGLDADGKVGPATQQHLSSVVMDRHIADFVAGIGEKSAAELRTFSDPAHPQSAMYCVLKGVLPVGTSEERLAQGTAACHMAGIKTPNDLTGIYIGDKSVLFTSNSLVGLPAQMDISQPAPLVQQTMLQVQQFDRQQAQVQTQNAQINQQQSQAPTPSHPTH